MIINIISRFFHPDDKNKIFFCRNYCNKMHSQKNMKNIYYFIKQIKLKYKCHLKINICNSKI